MSWFAADRARVVAGIFLALTATNVAAAPPVHVIKADLESLIRAAAVNPTQFAVHVPEKISVATSGGWTTAGTTATWRYSARIPTATSMSFHATRAALPAGTLLVVRTARTTVTYRPRDVHRGELWSRVQPGETLEFTLTVPAAERSQVALDIRSFQAGYRSLGIGAKDHPIYHRLVGSQGATSDASCVQNYECSVAPANAPAGQGTVGLIIGNQYQCSGTLVNDVPGDNTPYVLTARHCQSGKLGGGNPGAASTVTVYWDATTVCGSTLGALYDPSVPSQTGATTVVEQQDGWLIVLDQAPVVSDAKFAGFDASGGTVQGGYTIHHALGYDKQLTSWFGQAASVQQSGVLGTAYVSNFWEAVNQTGNIGPGASGSGLFDQNNRLVGSLSLGRNDADSSGYEACPVNSPPVPDGTNGAADFTALAAVWASTADTTSSLPTTTLKSVLDPGNTGTQVVSSTTALNVALTASFERQSINSSDPLTWSAAGATACTASGGAAGDGWSGALPASGTQTVTETNTGSVTFTLSCQFPSGRTIRRSASVDWVGPAPQLSLWSQKDFVWTNRPVNLVWTSNVGPCAITGGSTSAANLATNGSLAVTEASPADVTYKLACGTSTSSSTTWAVSYATPSLIFGIIGDDRLVGEPINVGWVSYADSCIPSRGAPNDGWTTSAFTGGFMNLLGLKVATLGTYTWTLNCVAGPYSVTQSVTTTVENNAPYTTAAVDTAAVTYSASPADYVTLSWESNLSTCTANSMPPMAGAPAPNPSLSLGGNPKSSVTLAPNAPGTYMLSVTCTALLSGSVTATSPPITIHVAPPAPPTATLSVSPSSVTTGQQFMITWASTNTSSCVASGGNAFQSPFVGNLASTNGSLPDDSQSLGTYMLEISCPSIDPNQAPGIAQATLTVGMPTPPTATLTASSTAVTNGQSLTFTWASTNATGCTASGGGANGSPWTGALATSGSVTQTTSTNGTFTYTVSCASGSQSAQASSTVSVSAPSSGGGGSGGGKGGGGAFGALELGLLAALASLRRGRGGMRVRAEQAQTTEARPRIFPSEILLAKVEAGEFGSKTFNRWPKKRLRPGNTIERSSTSVTRVRDEHTRESCGEASGPRHPPLSAISDRIRLRCRRRVAPRKFASPSCEA